MDMIGPSTRDSRRRRQVALLVGVLASAVMSVAACAPAPDAGDTPGVAEEQVQAQSVQRLGPMRQAAGSVTDHAGWAQWFQRPWEESAASDPGVFDALRYACPQGECDVAAQTRVGSCAALFNADAEGLDVEGMDEIQAAYLHHRLFCYAGRGIQAMRDASVSHVADYRLEPATLGELPAALGYAVDPEQFELARRIDGEGGNLDGFLRQALELSSADATPAPTDRLRLDDDDGWTREWLLLGRGDFDGDGTEDLLVGVNLYITDESLLFGSRLYVVTRPEDGAPMRLVSQIPLLGAPDGCDEHQECATDLLGPGD